MKKVQFCQLVRKLSEVEGISPSSILRRFYFIIIIINIIIIIIIISSIISIVIIVISIISTILIIMTTSMKTSTDEGVELDGSECGSGLIDNLTI